MNITVRCLVRHSWSAISLLEHCSPVKENTNEVELLHYKDISAAVHRTGASGEPCSSCVFTGKK